MKKAAFPPINWVEAVVSVPRKKFAVEVVGELSLWYLHFYRQPFCAANLISHRVIHTLVSIKRSRSLNFSRLKILMVALLGAVV